MDWRTVGLAAVFPVGLLLAVPALGNPYDDCILKHMGTAQNELAVNAIERACISKTSILIPHDEALKLLNGKQTARAGKFNVGGFSPENGLLIELQNTTSFAITDLVVTIKNNHTQKEKLYRVSYFPGTLPPGAMLAKTPEPSNIHIIPSGQTVGFFVPIPEVTDTVTDFSKTFSWDLTPILGIPPN